MTTRRLLFASLFGVAMGFLEATVVVYLRLLYYPGGFDFPLAQPPLSVALMELVREAATLLMLWAVAALAGRTGRERFAYFAYLFGIWDLVYYAGLKIMLGWPPSLLTWDVLFLIPLIWSGPVLAPVLVSLALIGGGLTILGYEARRICIQAQPLDIVTLAAALGLCLYCFMANHQAVFTGSRPDRFAWGFFGLAMVLGLGTLAKAVFFNPRSRQPRRYGLR